MKQFLLLLSLVTISVQLYAGDIRAVMCDKGDAVACYEFGKEIKDAPGRHQVFMTGMLNTKGTDIGKTTQLFGEGPTPQPDKVQYLYTKACKYGYAYACRKINKKFDDKEIATLQSKCETKDAKSCYRLGMIFHTRSLGGFFGTNSVDKILTQKANEYYKRSCTSGYAMGCYLVAQLNVSNFELDNTTEAVNYYVKACEFGNIRACNKLSDIYLEGYWNIEVNKEKANMYRKKACDYGDVQACSLLAFRFPENLSDPIARQYRVKACELGDASNCNILGVIYDNGTGVQQDSFKAVEYFKKACEADLKIGCTNLGIKYYTGQGVRQDFTKAIHSFENACYGGELNACNSLGEMYSNGIGVQQDFFKAKDFFVKSCPPPQKNSSKTILFSENYASAACNNLGFMYLKGMGVRQNLKKAKEYFGKACDGKNSDGCKNYATINQ